MKKLISFIIVILMLIPVGCGDTGNQTDTVQGNNTEYNPGIEEEFVDFNQKENWELAYPYMCSIGKPIKEITANYLDFEFVGIPEGYVDYVNSETKMYYSFDLSGNIDEFYGRKLTGDEICMGISGNLGCFFPNAEWPQNFSETGEYIKSYLGLAFWVWVANEEGYYYHVELEQNKYKIWIFSETGVITQESYMTISSWK